MDRTPDDFSRLNLYRILHGLPDGVTLANAEGRIVFSNEAADRILGTGAATEATPDEWSEYYGVFLPDGTTPFPTDQYSLVRALDGERTRDVEMIIRNPTDPRGSVIAVSGQPLLDEEQEIVGAAVVFRDITHLRRAEKLKEELAAFLVHDLKNPLTAILTVGELIERSPEATDQIREDAGAIRDAAGRMHRMVMDLLDIQLADDGALVLERRPISLPSFLEEVVSASRARLAARSQDIELGPVETGEIVADRPHLFRVLINLVDNCAKYGPEGGTVHVDTAPGTDGSVVIRVSDEGPGVPPHLRERIFDKYARAERDERLRIGSSKGLSWGEAGWDGAGGDEAEQGRRGGGGRRGHESVASERRELRVW